MAVAVAVAVAVLRRQKQHPLTPLHRLVLTRFCHCDADPAQHHHHIAAAPPHSAARPKSTFMRFAHRIQAAFERVRAKQLPPEARVASSNAVRSESDATNVAEQRIIHAMLEGDFEKLPGRGKPLQAQGNPHADPAEDLLYRILAQNGFAPEWVELNKEIRFHMERWRRALRYSWTRKTSTFLRDPARSEALWKADFRILEQELRDINRKVFHYNLIVPFGRQVFPYKLENELHELQSNENASHMSC